MIQYSDSIDSITPLQLDGGFFEGWPNPPLPETHLRLLQQSDHVWLAIDSDADKVVGFITAITDGVLSAYIPLLEVLPAYRGRGIGQGLVKRLLNSLSGYYMIDVVCDESVKPFYEKFGMRPGVGMMVRNFEKQSGIKD